MEESAIGNGGGVSSSQTNLKSQEEETPTQYQGLKKIKEEKP